jgi:hypothetical protein
VRSFVEDVVAAVSLAFPTSFNNILTPNPNLLLHIVVTPERPAVYVFSSSSGVSRVAPAG